MTYYDQLGVQRDASPEQIKTAYRALVLLFHPDRLQQLSPAMRSFAEDRLKALNEAYTVLGDADRRAHYDASLGVPVATAPARPAAPPQPEPEPAPPPEPAPADARLREQLWLNEQIAELEQNLRHLTAERDRAHAALQAEGRRTGRRFWVLAALTTLGAWVVMLGAVGLYALPAPALSGLARLLALVGLAAVYEYAAALLLTRACSPAGVRLNYAAVARATALGLLAGGAAGAAGWAAWRLIFFEVNSLLSLLVLGLIFTLAHLASLLAGLGGLLRAARYRQRAFDAAHGPLLRMHRSQLEVLHARRRQRSG